MSHRVTSLTIAFFYPARDSDIHKVVKMLSKMLRIKMYFFKSQKVYFCKKIQNFIKKNPFGFINHNKKTFCYINIFRKVRLHYFAIET